MKTSLNMKSRKDHHSTKYIGNWKNQKEGQERKKKKRKIGPPTRTTSTGTASGPIFAGVSASKTPTIHVLVTMAKLGRGQSRSKWVSAKLGRSQKWFASEPDTVKRHSTNSPAEHLWLAGDVQQEIWLKPQN